MFWKPQSAHLCSLDCRTGKDNSGQHDPSCFWHLVSGSGEDIIILQKIRGGIPFAALLPPVSVFRTRWTFILKSCCTAVSSSACASKEASLDYQTTFVRVICTKVHACVVWLLETDAHNSTRQGSSCFRHSTVAPRSCLPPCRHGVCRSDEGGGESKQIWKTRRDRPRWYQTLQQLAPALCHEKRKRS